MKNVLSLTLLAALTMSVSAQARPTVVVASADPAAPGEKISFRMNVTEAQPNQLAWYQLWVDGTPTGPRRMITPDQRRSLHLSPPVVSEFGNLIARTGGTKINYKVQNYKNESVSGSFNVPLKTAAVPAAGGSTNLATKISSARYSGGVIQIQLDGIAGPDAKIEADIWPVGKSGKRCIDESMNSSSNVFSKNVTRSMLASGQYQSRAHLLRKGKLVGYFDIRGITR